MNAPRDKEQKPSKTGASEKPTESHSRFATASEVIEASRRKYGRPRAEVEQMIAEQMGWNENGEQARPTAGKPENLKRRLLSLGVTEKQAESLLDSFSVRRIERQLDWLPFRNPKRPASLMVAAIKGDYQKPAALSKKRNDNSKKPRQ